MNISKAGRVVGGMAMVSMLGPALSLCCWETAGPATA